MAEQVKARITRGGSTVSSYNNQGQFVAKTRITEEPKYDKITNLKVQPKENDLVGQIKIVLMNGRISFPTAASCIVGEIRKIYFKSINRPDSYDIQILNYMDKILFNNLADMFEGIIHFGSECFPKSIIEQTISDVVDIMETQPNMQGIRHVIDRLYEEF